jgi:hypothetical protein
MTVERFCVWHVRGTPRGHRRPRPRVDADCPALFAVCSSSDLGLVVCRPEKRKVGGSTPPLTTTLMWS